jgi:FAD/FMN-containing dehydrogenase
MPAASSYSQFIGLVRPQFQGRLLEPTDTDYHNARTVFNAAIDRHPAVIARCATADDVALAIRCAGTLGLHPAIRGGGHSVAGWSTTDGLVIDLSAMKSIRIDRAAGFVRAGAGATWGELDRVTAQFGLAVPGGIISTTGIAGLTLGGGVGWLVRKYGLSCDNLVSAVIVTSDGRSLRASDTDNADLFWALRGGGGNFGVVTEFTYRLHPVATVFGGRVVFDFAKGEALLNQYREFSESLPEDCTASIGFGQRPDGRPVVSMLFCHLGQPEDLGRLRQAIADCGPPLENSAQARSYVSMQRLLDDSFPPGRRAYWRSYYLSGLGGGAIAALLEWSRRAPSPFSSVLLERYTGAASRVAVDGTAFPHRAEPYNVHILACWTDASDDDENFAWADAFWRALRPYTRGAVYANFLGDEGDARIRAAYGGNYDRLVELKRAYDPANMFRLNNNIDPGRRPRMASRHVQLASDMEVSSHDGQHE